MDWFGGRSYLANRKSKFMDGIFLIDKGGFD